MGKGNKYTCIIDSLISFYTLEPMLDQLFQRSCHLIVICSPEVEMKMKQLFPSANIEFQNTESLFRKVRFLNKVHNIFLTLITPSSFSYQYRLLTHPKARNFNIVNWSVYLLAKIFPKVKVASINGVLHSFFKRFNKFEFSTDIVIVASRFSYPGLLCSDKFRVITIIESWDHPVKIPVGYRSSIVFTWNDQLNEDWINNQGDKNVHVGYPFKLRDWFGEDFITAPNTLRNHNKKFMYAIGSSSFSTLNDMYQSELFVIDKICAAAKRAGYTVVLKPKPNGRKGDFDKFINQYDNVSLGTYSNAKSTSGYYLDKSYNLVRKQEVADCDFVMNTITTFAIDSALLGLPVVQLDLRKCDAIKGVTGCQNNHHLERYIVSSNAFVCNSLDEMEETIYNAILHYEEKALKKSEELYNWITPKETMDEAVNRMCDLMMQSAQ